MLDRVVTVRFDSNVNPALSWKSEPVQRSMDLQIGETGLAFYRATNTGDETIVGTATYNVTPDKVGLYFDKIECFCFTEQVLRPGESVDMPRSEEHTSELQSLMRISYAVFCLQQKKQ